MNKLKEIFEKEAKIMNEVPTIPYEISSLYDVDDIREILSKFYESIINIKEGLLSFISDAQVKRSSKYLRKEAIDKLENILNDYIRKLSDIIYELDRRLRLDITSPYEIAYRTDDITLLSLCDVLRDSLNLIESIRDELFEGIIPLIEWDEHKHIALYITVNVSRILYYISSIKRDISDLSRINDRLKGVEEKLESISSRIQELSEIPVRIDEYIRKVISISSDILNVIMELYDEVTKMIEEHIEKYRIRGKIPIST
jgi:hypothetical protein